MTVNTHRSAHAATQEAGHATPAGGPQAAERVVARLGAQGVRVTDVAAEAGLSPAAVLYHYPTRAELIRVAFERAFDRFGRHRAAVVAAIDDPAERLVAMLREGFPSGPDDEEVVGLYTGVQAIRDDPELAALVREVTERPVTEYAVALIDLTAGGERHADAVVPLNESLRSDFSHGRAGATSVGGTVRIGGQ